MNGAIEEYDQGYQVEPTNYAPAYNLRGYAYEIKGEVDCAIQDYNTAINLEPNYTEAYVNRGMAYSQKGELQRAIKDFNTAIDAQAKLRRGPIIARGAGLPPKRRG